MNQKDEKRNATKVGELPGKPIETLGGVFADGSFLEVVHDSSDRDALKLLLFDGEIAQIGARVEHNNQIYVVRKIDPAIARELHLPAEFRPKESNAQLAADIVGLVQKYCGLEEEAAELLALFFFAGWVADALPTAPTLVIIGPETREVNQLLALIKCLARHCLLLTEITANGLGSLPTDLGLTLAIDQSEFNDPLQRLLNTARKHTVKVARHGTLWSPRFSKALRCDTHFNAAMVKGARIVIAPHGRRVPLLDDREQARIASEFQPRLLAFRFANHATVRARIAEDANFDPSAPAQASALPAAKFEDGELHAKIRDLVAENLADTGEERWTDPGNVLIEVMLMSCHIPGQMERYMGQYADVMMTILSARGEERKILPNQVGPMIRSLGLKTEPRDSQGVRLILTDNVRKKIHKLGRDFEVPSNEALNAGCLHCEALRTKKN
jgi:hypothetical protein